MDVHFEFSLKIISQAELLKRDDLFLSLSSAMKHIIRLEKNKSAYYIEGRQRKPMLQENYMVIKRLLKAPLY